MARSSRLESGFQDGLIQRLKNMFPGCMVFKMDQIQGLPDLLVLYQDISLLWKPKNTTMAQAAVRSRSIVRVTQSVWMS